MRFLNDSIQEKVMRFLKLFISIVVCSIPLLAQSYEIEFSRSYNKVMTPNNQLLIKINSQGQGTVDFPDFYQFTGQAKISDQSSQLDKVETLVGTISAQKNQSSLKTKLAAVKKYHNLPLFYSSDVDLFTLRILDENKVILDVSFNNWEELNHSYAYMGDWQPMIDLVNTIQQASIETHNRMIKERAQ